MLPVKRKCPVCGKKFFIDAVELWVYKRGTNHGQIYFCSWKCIREHDRAKTKRIPGLSGRAAQIKNLLEKGVSDSEISETLGVKQSTIDRWKNRIYEMGGINA